MLNVNKAKGYINCLSSLSHLGFKWILVNLIICNLPLGLMFLLERSHQDIFSNYLAYGFTLIISEIYFLSKDKDNKFNPKLLRFWLFLCTIIILAALYTLYPNFNNTATLEIFFESHLQTIAISLTLYIVMLFILLNLSNINKNIQEVLAKKSFDTPEAIKSKTPETIKELGKEKFQ